MKFRITKTTLTFIYILLLLLSFNTSFGQGQEARAYFEEGFKAYEDRLLIEATVLFTEAISQFEKYATAYDYRGRAFIEMGQEEKGIDDLKRALNYDQNLFVPKYQLIQQFKKRGLHKEGIDMSTMMLKHHPENSAGALYDRAHFYLKLNKNDEAISDLKAILDLDNLELKDFKKQVKEKISELKD